MDQVEEELRAARARKYALGRVTALTALLPRLAPSDRPMVIAEILAGARTFQGFDLSTKVFLEVSAQLSPQDERRVIDEMHSAARLIFDRRSRSLVFARLAPLLPEQDRTFALIEAWLGTACLQAEAPDRALIEFALTQRQSRQAEIFEEALCAAEELNDADVWLGAMRAIVRYLPEPLLPSVANANRGLWKASARVESLIKLGADLPQRSKQSLLTMALQVARSETDQVSRAGGLHLLSSVLPETDKKALLNETLEAIRAIDSADDQTKALARLLPDLPTDLLEEGFSVAVAIKNFASRSRAIIALAPILPEFLQERIVDAVKQLEPRRLQYETLLALSRAQPKLFFNKLRNHALAIPDAESRAHAFVEVAQLSPESERHGALLLALSAARLINDRISRARLLLEIATGLPEKERHDALRDALDMLQDIEPRERVLALKQLARFIPQGTFSPFVELLKSATDLISPEEMLEIQREIYRGIEFESLQASALLTGRLHANLESKEAELFSREHVVNTGFTSRSNPAQAIDPTTSLSIRESYFFWVEVGVPLPMSIELSPTGLPAFSETVRLKVAIMAMGGDLAIDPNAAVGELELGPDGSVSIVSQPEQVNDARIGADLLKRRLFFSIQPLRTGLCRFRCNIYYERILVQSRLISARVSEQSRQMHYALRSELDYTLSGTLNPARLKKLTPHQMSLLFATTEKTFSFSFFGGVGEELVKREATLDVLELKDVIEQARGILRRVAWGDEEDWESTKSYRYAGKAPLEQLKDDLISLAIRGYRLYDSIIDRVTGGRDKSHSLQQAMRTPGLIQVAIAESPRQHMPATLFYDYRLDTAVGPGGYRICSGFLQALDDGAPLEESDCFRGHCKSRDSADEDRVVCPSGFWGFRHELGMPLSVKSSLEAPATIAFEREPLVVAGVSTDPAFTLWTGHEQILRQFRENLAWTCAENRSDLFALLKKSKPHVLYFYCHGGIKNGVPYIQVGSPAEYVITRDNFRNERFSWDETWPLVFINGCRTLELDPSKALELVSACLQCSASGVVGTEITLFEPLACAFAEEFMKRFLVGVGVGEAIRGARLALLKENNPLGLVYIPYALASLKLVGADSLSTGKTEVAATPSES